jgi:hypothetical protein
MLDYHTNACESHQLSAMLHASGAREFLRRGLMSTAAMWQELAAYHARWARIELQRASDILRSNQ